MVHFTWFFEQLAKEFESDQSGVRRMKNQEKLWVLKIQKYLKIFKRNSQCRCHNKSKNLIISCINCWQLSSSSLSQLTYLSDAKQWHALSFHWTAFSLPLHCVCVCVCDCTACSLIGQNEIETVGWNQFGIWHLICVRQLRTRPTRRMRYG